MCTSHNPRRSEVWQPGRWSFDHSLSWQPCRPCSSWMSSSLGWSRSSVRWQCGRGDMLHLLLIFTQLSSAFVLFERTRTIQIPSTSSQQLSLPPLSHSFHVFPTSSHTGLSSSVLTFSSCQSRSTSSCSCYLRGLGQHLWHCFAGVRVSSSGISGASNRRLSTGLKCPRGTFSFSQGTFHGLLVLCRQVVWIFSVTRTYFVLLRILMDISGPICFEGAPVYRAQR